MMSGFIEIVGKDKNRRLLNIRHIEEVTETSDKDICMIYLIKDFYSLIIKTKAYIRVILQLASNLSIPFQGHRVL